MLERRAVLGGPVPRRVVVTKTVELPGDPVYGEFMTGSGKQEVSTTMAFTKLLRNLLRDKVIGDRIVPIIPDEARTFGMDPLFKEVGIYSALGQLYEPVDSNLVLSYREATDGQVLEEGITEAGSSASFQASGTAYATHGEPIIPFYIFYSMFGFQRTGDEFWAFGDARGRGFVLGATAGRTTLNGEGLQHEDGHSLVLASVIPAIRVYDPAFAYETAVLVRDGINRMYGAQPQDVFYYLTLYNENYVMPERPEGLTDEEIVRGLYLFRRAPAGASGGHGKAPLRAAILSGGSIMQQALRAQELLAERGVAANVWSGLSYQLLRNEALEADRWNRLHPDEEPRTPVVTELLREPAEQGPIIAVSDYITAWPDMIARWVPGGWWRSLGTDGYGRSDTREALRRFFEIDAEHIAATTLAELARCGRIDARDARKQIEELGVDPEAPFALYS
jgi:pyruvate dehydrogenase E1 component